MLCCAVLGVPSFFFAFLRLYRWSKKLWASGWFLSSILRGWNAYEVAFALQKQFYLVIMEEKNMEGIKSKNWKNWRAFGDLKTCISIRETNTIWFPQANFPQSCVKMLVNPSGWSALFPCLTKNLLCGNSATLHAGIFRAIRFFCA